MDPPVFLMYHKYNKFNPLNEIIISPKYILWHIKQMQQCEYIDFLWSKSSIDPDNYWAPCSACSLRCGNARWS